MTKLQVNFKLQKPLDDFMMARIADAYSLYGIQKVKIAPTLDSLMVEYDATRLRPAEVEAALSNSGIPVEPA
jgi:hypothetical protein